jgi:pyridoxal 5'-phosphate synthase pdxT subunit
MGTCAGMVMLAKEGDDQVTRTRTKQLGVMDFQVQRNAFGRQRESSETEIEIDLPGLEGDADLPVVFIRAPCAKRVWGDARAISYLDGRVIGVRQGRRLALSFHPELTDDTRIHEAFLRLAKE